MENTERNRYDRWVVEAARAMKHASMVIRDAGPSDRPAAHAMRLDVLKCIRRLLASRPEEGAGAYDPGPSTGVHAEEENKF